MYHTHASIKIRHLPNAYHPHITHAIYKQSPADFVVNEILPIDFANDGEHLWLYIRKTLLNTQYVAKLLAKWANIPIKDVGFSGLKDRLAITTQFFSLRIPKKILPNLSFEQFLEQYEILQPDEAIQVISQHWHDKKLQRGTHKLNQFIITLKQVKGEKNAIAHQLSLIKKHGVPNYFGEQRFGHDDNNLSHALDLFSKKLKLNPKKDKDRLSIYLSSARSELFNAILAKRVRENSWQTPMLGDVMNLAASHSIFTPTIIDDTIINRLMLADIHLTGAMWGAGELQSFGDVAKLEQNVIDSRPDYQLLAQGLVDFGLKQQRRALRLVPINLSWQWLDKDTLQLTFMLPAGSFATTVLHCLMTK